MRRLEERDLRSLERRSMYSIFAPLDAEERAPRRMRRAWPTRWSDSPFSLLWLPSVFALLTLEVWRQVPPAIDMLSVGALLAVFLGLQNRLDRGT